jgi:toxin ParE1/3/4
VTLRLELRPGVAEELAEAVAYYESERVGLGERLLNAVEATFIEISSAPDLGPPCEWDGSIRRQFVRRFPYVVFYRASEEVVTVFAVAHGKRRPGYWR